MHSYLVVSAKPGRAIPPHVLELLDQPAPADLAFIADGHVRWDDALGRLAFGGWQAATDVFEMGSHWHVDDQGITSFSGRMWPHGGMWAPGRSWAEQLGEHWRARPHDKVGQPYDGIFTAASLRRDGTGEIVTDPLSAAMIYRAESNDLVAYSTRPGLAARATSAAGEEPARDPIGSGWMIYIGHLFGDRTGFERVRVLPLGSYVELHPRFGSRVRTANPTPWVNPDGLPEDPGELVDLVHEDLAQRVESIAKLRTGVVHRADITGGRDSRLILALLVEAGLTDRFRFSTVGAATSPDAIVGRELASLCGLDFEPVDPQPMEPDTFLRRLQTHLFQSSGMGSAWDLQGGVGISRAVTVSGLFGEPLKTQFSEYPPLETSDDLLDLYLTSAHVDTLQILRPDAREWYRRFIAEDLVERVDAESSLPFDRLDAFYARNRLRRWGGTTEEIGNSARTFPLYSLVALQAGFVLGAKRRRDEFLHFHVMRAACPMLAEHRFASRGWRDSLLAEVDDGERYRVEPCTHAPPPEAVADPDVDPDPDHDPEPAPEPLSWQADRFERHRDVIEAYLLNEPSSPLFEVVDREALVGVLEGDFPDGFHPRYQIFGALAAAVWLGHHEKAVLVGQPDVRLVAPDPLPPVPDPPPPPPSASAVLLRRVARRAPAPVRRGLRRGQRALQRTPPPTLPAP